MTNNTVPIGIIVIKSADVRPHTSIPLNVVSVSGVAVSSDGDLTGATLEFFTRLPAGDGIPAGDYRVSAAGGENYTISLAAVSKKLYLIPETISDAVGNIVVRLNGALTQNVTIVFFGNS